MIKKNMVKILVIVFLTVMCISPNADARMVTMRSNSSGFYEDGVYTPRNDRYEAQCVIDEVGGIIEIDKVLYSDREGKTEEGVVYEITNTQVSRGISSLFVAKRKKGQKILTAVRENDIEGVEVLILGEDFYEFCRCANGKIYLESGDLASLDKL